MSPWRQALSPHERIEYDRLRDQRRELANAMRRLQYVGERRVRYAEDRAWAAEARRV